MGVRTGAPRSLHQWSSRLEKEGKGKRAGRLLSDPSAAADGSANNPEPKELSQGPAEPSRLAPAVTWHILRALHQHILREVGNLVSEGRQAAPYLTQRLAQAGAEAPEPGGHRCGWRARCPLQMSLDARGWCGSRHQDSQDAALPPPAASKPRPGRALRQGLAAVGAERDLCPFPRLPTQRLEHSLSTLVTFISFLGQSCQLNAGRHNSAGKVAATVEILGDGWRKRPLSDAS